MAHHLWWVISPYQACSMYYVEMDPRKVHCSPICAIYVTPVLNLMGKLFISDVLSCQKIWKKEDKKRMFYIDMETTPA